MSASLDVAIVLVGYNSREYLGACLESVFRTEWRGYTHETIYLDNASSDGSLEYVRRLFPAVRAIANRGNAGFCAACNQGAALTASRYVYLLNCDTVLFPDSAPLLVEFLDRTPRAGVAGNRLLNPDLSEQWSARRFPTGVNALLGRRSRVSRGLPNTRLLRRYLYKEELARGEPFAVDWVPGSCSMVRREALEQVGGLPQYMHYWSDAVFCDRLRRAGWDCYVVPRARLIHAEGNGTGRKSAATRRWLIRDFHGGAYRFYCEHFQMSAWNPWRWLAGLGLSTRATLLIAADWLASVRAGAMPPAGEIQRAVRR